ncbi:unnamed protein product [Auanema sp. JU1783]|nr:unnamed protein product [Auanema sp. JU1783]
MEDLNINRFHVLCFLLWQFALFFCCQQLFPIFYNFMPKRECLDRSFHWSKAQCLLTNKEQCDELMNCSRIVVEKPIFHSIIEDFDLFCGERAYDATLVATIQFVGVLCGTLIYGQLGDQFGRRSVSFCGISIGIIFGIASGFAPSWEVFAAFRFIVGTSIACILIVFYSYIVELILPNQRVFLRSFFNWGYARIVFTFVCWLCGHWRSAAIATALLPLPILPILLLLLPESPKWFYEKKRMEDGKKAENRISVLSGKELSSENMSSCFAPSTKVYTIKNLFSTKKLTKTTLVLGALWFSTSLSAFGSDLNSGNLAGSFYVTQFISGFVTAFAKIFVFVLDYYWPSFDRRRLHQYPQIMMILCYTAIMMIMIFAPESDCNGNTWKDWTIIVINIIGVSLIEITWDACYLVAVECFPTQIRTIGVGTCSLLARIGALLAPQMAYFSNLAAALPYALVVGISVISLVISILFLPNTKNINLSDVQFDDVDEE